MARGKFRSSRAMDQALLNIDIEGFFNALDRQRALEEAARIARGPTEADIKLARMRRARGMPYSKWALGETE
jgi:hypothetical protein